MAAQLRCAELCLNESHNFWSNVFWKGDNTWQLVHSTMFRENRAILSAHTPQTLNTVVK